MYPKMINMLAGGLIDLKPIITNVVPFNEIASVFDAFSRDISRIKILIEINKEHGK
jgi:threonine dehydrogenase-like Zn-dependent dehydrogenase